MKLNLKPKQKEFLELLTQMNEIAVIKLSPKDRVLINETVLVGYYYDHERTELERMRKRWKEERPNADYTGFY